MIKKNIFYCVSFLLPGNQIWRKESDMHHIEDFDWAWCDSLECSKNSSNIIIIANIYVLSDCFLSLCIPLKCLRSHHFESRNQKIFGGQTPEPPLWRRRSAPSPPCGRYLLPTATFSGNFVKSQSHACVHLDHIFPFSFILQETSTSPWWCLETV